MLGTLLKDIRIELQISQETLIEGGLCTPGMLKKYEKGGKQPEKLLGDALWQRMGKSMEKFQVFLEQDEYELACTRAHIQILIRQGKLARAKEAVCAYEKMDGTDRALHRQFLCLQRAEISRQEEKSYEEQMGTVREGLAQTISCAFLPEILKTHRFGMLELLLLERYAFLLEQKSPEEAVQWYLELQQYLTGEGGMDYDRADQYRLLPPVLYHYAVWADGAMLYPLALEQIEKGCQMLRKRQAFLPLFIKMEELRLKVLPKLGQEIPAWEQGCLCLLKEMMEEYDPAWKQNIYPDYPEQFIYCVNATLRERRLAHGKTIHDMAGAFDPRTLRAAESGKRMPQSATKNALFQELGLSTYKYGGSLVTRRYSDFRDSAELIDCNYNKEYEQAEQIYKRLAGGLDRGEVLNEQFIKYWDIRLRYSKGTLTERAYREELWKMLEETLPKCRETDVDCVLTEYEREIVEILGWNVKPQDAAEIEKILCVQYQKFCNDDALVCFFSEYYTALAYCLGRLSQLKQDFAQSKKIFSDILEQFYFLQDDFRLESIFFQQFRLDEDMKKAQGGSTAQNDKKIFQKIRYAYAISKFYLCDSVCSGFIEDYLDKYYKDNTEILHGLR